MVLADAEDENGVMSHSPPEADTGFDPRKARGITDVKRADDRMIGGVCTGMGRYFNLDPVVLRVLLVALTFVGFAGVILYVAAWILLPAENEPKSLAAQWFKLNENEEQFRIIGLIVAAFVALIAGSGILGGDWDTPYPWLCLLVFMIGYVAFIRPAQRRRARQQSAPLGTMANAVSTDGDAVTEVLPPHEPKTPWSPALTFITLSAALIVVGALALWANGSVSWASYAVAALSVIGLGLLMGTLWGNANLLIPIGGIIAIGLAAATLLPSMRIGHAVYPAGETTIADTYRLGIGQLDLDLNKLNGPSMLEGRTIKVQLGVGESRIVIPADVNVEVRSTLHLGEIRIFDRTISGTQNQLSYAADHPLAPKLTLDISQSVGNIEVIRQ